MYKSFVNQLYAKNGHVSQNYKTQIFFFVTPVVLSLAIFIAIHIIHLVIMAFMFAVY